MGDQVIQASRYPKGYLQSICDDIIKEIDNADKKSHMERLKGSNAPRVEDHVQVNR